jgi:hypothetical protein
VTPGRGRRLRRLANDLEVIVKESEIASRRYGEEGVAELCWYVQGSDGVRQLHTFSRDGSGRKAHTPSLL